MEASSEEVQRVRAEAELIRSATEITSIIERMATEVEAKIGDQYPVIVPVMIGGAFTAVELCRHFEFAYELDWVHVSRYGRGLTGGDLQWHASPRLDLRGRTVLLVDDVLDRGVTLTEILREFRLLEPDRLHAAVLVSKELDEDIERPAVDFVGTSCADRYLFGCGMDYKGYWRGLPALYAVAQS